ncbi:uncharacterized protein LOC136092247 [Hydra vulgaris]|uniref:Uncharacterized protein LOC136092247 n=1 Tax=Hydra vulgaris TaxID=6087 RepID=A0ABM4DNE9_HYDVU
MNMHSISKTAFRNINNKLFSAYENSSLESMQDAANEAKMEEIVPCIHSCRVSIDGTCQKSGHSSLNGVVTAVSKGKCLDVIVLSKHCRQCIIWGVTEYTNWKVAHNCKINHRKSSEAMESSGAIDIFQQSVSRNKLAYNEYLGDKDTASYKEVINSKPYEAQFGITPVKLECVRQVNKQIGSQLRTLVQ